jgi:hypothetical protein
MVDAEVASLVSERSKLRAEKLYDAADEIHKKLLNLGFEVIDKADGGTDVTLTHTSDAVAPKHVEWYQLPLPTPALHSSPPPPICTFVATCNSTAYRERCSLTLDHLSTLPYLSSPTPVPLLSLSEVSYPAKRILWEGWLEVLLPRLMRDVPPSLPFVLVLEDDARVFHSHEDLLSTLHIRLLAAFMGYPDLDMISVGHSGSHPHLHAATALVIRTSSFPRIISTLSSIPASKRTHLDLFLFSQQHVLGIGLFNPPLFGWAESEVTLTPAGSGQRRKGGGRLAAQEPRHDVVTFIARGIDGCNRPPLKKK